MKNRIPQLGTFIQVAEFFSIIYQLDIDPRVQLLRCGMKRISFGKKK
jgi:hypothetical protein